MNFYGYAVVDNTTDKNVLAVYINAAAEKVMSGYTYVSGTGSSADPMVVQAVAGSALNLPTGYMVKNTTGTVIDKSALVDGQKFSVSAANGSDTMWYVLNVGGVLGNSVTDTALTDVLDEVGKAEITGSVPAGDFGYDPADTEKTVEVTLSGTSTIAGDTSIYGDANVTGKTTVTGEFTAVQVNVANGATLAIDSSATFIAKEIDVKAGGIISFAGIPATFTADAVIVFGTGQNDSYVNGVSFAQANNKITYGGVMGAIQAAIALGLIG